MNKNRIVLICISVILFSTHPIINVSAQSGLCELPDWFFKTSNYNSRNLSIGISDPKMQTEEAYKQAKLRALLNYSLLNNTEFNSLITSSMGNHMASPANILNLEYVLYASILKGPLASVSSINTLDSFYTKNNEAIVLIELDENSNVNTDNFIIHRRAGFMKENNRYPLFVDELEIMIVIGDSVLSTTSLYKKENKLLNKEEEMESFKIDFATGWQFSPYEDVGSKRNKELYCTLKTGLWNAFIFNMVDQICIYNSFKSDNHNKLTSSNIASNNKKDNNEIIQQFIYSIKNVQSRKIDPTLSSISISRNNLNICLLYKGIETDFYQNTVTKINNRDRRELKKLNQDNWQYVGNQDFENAWLEVKSKMNNNTNSIIAVAEIRADNLNSGLIEAIQLAKLELSSQLKAKVTSLVNSSLSNNEQVYLQSAKLSNLSKTEQIKPFYIFYRKINEIAYEVKTFLFYDLN